ncbi:MAG TPA: hypothetical protein PLK94_05170 [Alphaproteobacteria bacterium]|nr:hypothetical protein [Alphaproteobacteria bacterium]
MVVSASSSFKTASFPLTQHAAFSLEELVRVLNMTKPLIRSIVTKDGTTLSLQSPDIKPRDVSFRTKKGQLICDFKGKKLTLRQVNSANNVTMDIEDGKIRAYAVPSPQTPPTVQQSVPQPQPTMDEPSAPIPEELPQTDEHKLYHKIVVEHDANALALYLKDNVSRLAYFANRHAANKWPIDDLQQEITLRLLEYQDKSRQGNPSGFCNNYKSFNSWVISVSRTVAIQRFKIAGPLDHSGYSTTEERPKDKNSFGQDFLCDMPGLPEQSMGQDPLYILQEAETTREYQALIERLQSGSEIPNTGLLVEWGRRQTAESDEFGEGKDNAELAQEQGCAEVTIRTRIFTARKRAEALGLKPEFI